MHAPIGRTIDLTPLTDWIAHRLTEMEHRLMTTQAEAFAAVSAKIDDIKADFTALLAQLAAERENLTEAGQAALDELTAKVTDLDVAVGDADGSDAPVEEPVAEAPTEG